ncbi:MAG: acyl-CoA/acyl-ACP dehydrogenase [Thermoplasmata archaeon]|uniref:Acyl-CoA/acyl-ACP dehydrogenase n=1 Tax=Candidatus Sysuiplasma superficiale TaxID=2823368 RepID=A0A8J8CEQ1_9ARCH|nr:acyl-CoA/acyl-ACP dehydrogenase [Candidatus Sysuiplasma superficiale]MBX8644917.1 acyl-CoA/acyl-ACP dehydrogenase [Candidatus Sysuiplasma superficiale]
MDFSLPKEVEETRRRAREFALREFLPEIASKYDAEEKYPDGIRKKAFAEGFLNFSNPWGLLVTMEEFCRVDPGLGLSAVVPAFGSEVLLLYGNEEQKRKYLDPVMKGEKISGFAITDSTAGSDVAGIGATLTRKDGKYLLNGQKIFITNGAIADHFYLLARSSPPPSEEKRHRGLTLVIVESRSKGFAATQLKGKLGMRATNTAELTFRDVEVPPGNIIGEEGKGFYIVMTFFNISRIYVAAQSVGIAQGVFDRLLAYIGDLRKRGNPAAEFESTQFLVAELASRIEASRLLTYRAASYLFNFNPDPAATSIAKYFAAETAAYAAGKVLEFMGADGITTDVERFYRDAKITEIWEGTSEIEKLIIARMLLQRGDKK